MKSRPDPVRVLQYILETATKPKRPDRVLSYDELKGHPEYLTLSIKDLWKAGSNCTENSSSGSGSTI